MSGGPLSGVRVLDLSSVVVGPVATLILAEQGAEVIKVEPPSGDLIRTLGGSARVEGMSPKFIHFNRGKQSVVLDIKKPADGERLLDLVASADVLVTNMRPAALGRLGLNYRRLAAVQPELIYCSIVGFGEGPYRDKPAYDTVIQGSCGIAACIAEVTGSPRYVPFVMTDHTVGIFASQAICAALFARERTGRGQFVEVPMFETMAAFVLREHMGQRTFAEDGAYGDRRVMNTEAAPIQTADGHICISPNTNQQVFAFFDAIGRPELKGNPRFNTVAARLANVADYLEVRRDSLLSQPTSHWLALFDRLDIPALPYNRLEDLLADPHLRAAGLVRERTVDGDKALELRSTVTFSDSGSPELARAPRLGEHTHAVLSAPAVARTPSDSIAS